MNLIELTMKCWEGTREHLITLEVEGDGIEEEDLIFRVSVKNLRTQKIRRAECVISKLEIEDDLLDE